MPSAISLILDPSLGIDPITDTAIAASDENAIFLVKKDEIEDLTIKILQKGKKSIRTNLRPLVTEATIEESLLATPTFTITLHDPDWELLNSGALEGNVDINPGGIPRRWYRLDTYSVNNDEITLVFATRNAIFLTLHKRPYKTSRNKVTRAQFIQSLVRKVKIVRIPFFCPQVNEKQKIAKYSGETARKKARNRQQGFTSSDKITVKH